MPNKPEKPTGKAPPPVSFTMSASSSLSFDDLVRAFNLFQRAGVNAAQTISLPNGGGTNMAYKAKPGDLVILINSRGGRVAVGDKGSVVRVDSDGYGTTEYIVNFPAQQNYRLRAADFDLAAMQLMDVTDYTVKKGVDFDSVILEDAKKEQILEALEQLNYMDLIFKKWGFGKTMEKGRGISMLFYGEPGTGKTLMAQAIADKLDYELKVIATAEIESSEPGQAERNIRAHFEGHNGKRTVLLFDECDSLIYDRTTVGAIMGAQVNELLTSLEKFEGITIFTTNRLGTLDEAVNRRLSLKLEFAMPTFEERIGIWQRMFPKEAPLAADVVWEKLANVEISGGYIKNTVLRAARMAACQKAQDGTNIPDNEKKIQMAHLIKALRLEVEAMMEFQDAKKQHGPRIGPMGRGASQTQDYGRDKYAGLSKKADVLRTMELEEGEGPKHE